MLRVEQVMLMANAKEKSIFEIPLDAAEEARLDALADAEIDAGNGVDHKKVREWLLQLAKVTPDAVRILRVRHTAQLPTDT